MFRLQADSRRYARADVAGLIGFHAGAEVTDTPSWITVACKQPLSRRGKGQKPRFRAPRVVILLVPLLLNWLAGRKRVEK